MILNRLLKDTIRRLETLLGDFAVSYAERILQHCFSCTRSELYLKGDLIVDEAVIRRIDGIVERCLIHEPLDYILGVSYFYDREFNVSPAVLIPRPDTEVLVETVLNNETASMAFFADIGIGSGIISCVLTEKKEGWNAVGIDCSIDALHIARCNSRNSRIALVAADFLTAFAARRQFDFVVSNPPYIPVREIEKLDKSVSCFEPRLALDGGEDGLDFYRMLAKQASSFIRKKGCLYCEIGFDQESIVRELFVTSGWDFLGCFKDLGGHPRVLRMRCRN